MAGKINVHLKVGRWVKKVILSFIVCAILIFCLSVLIQRYNISQKYMAIVLFICCAFYLYQIFLITKIRCPNCNEVLIFILFTGDISSNFKSYKMNKCNNCGKEFD